MKQLNLKTLTAGLVAFLLMSGIFANQAFAAAPLARIVVAKSGGNYTTITAALNAITPTATNPYVIEVWPGVYTETTSVNLKSYVHLKGSGRDVTTVKTSQGTNASVIIADGLTKVSISGLNITGGQYGIFWARTDGTISDNQLSNNSLGISMQGAGDTSNPLKSVSFIGNIVNNNTSYGIEFNRATAVATDNIITRNCTAGGYGITIANDRGATPPYANLVISGNVINAHNCTAIGVAYDSAPTISNNEISDNASGILYTYVTSGGVAHNNKIVNSGIDVTVSDVASPLNNGTPPNFPNISFNVFDDIGGTTRGVGSYNVNSNGDPILVP